jgi:hypothetical protein
MRWRMREEPLGFHQSAARALKWETSSGFTEEVWFVECGRDCDDDDGDERREMRECEGRGAERRRRSAAVEGRALAAMFVGRLVYAVADS